MSRPPANFTWGAGRVGRPSQWQSNAQSPKPGMGEETQRKDGAESAIDNSLHSGPGRKTYKTSAARDARTGTVPVAVPVERHYLDVPKRKRPRIQGKRAAARTMSGISERPGIATTPSAKAPSNTTEASKKRKDPPDATQQAKGIFRRSNGITAQSCEFPPAGLDGPKVAGRIAVGSVVGVIAQPGLLWQTWVGPRNHSAQNNRLPRSSFSTMT